jgi:hypothetical protein
MMALKNSFQLPEERQSKHPSTLNRYNSVAVLRQPL